MNKIQFGSTLYDSLIPGITIKEKLDIAGISVIQTDAFYVDGEIGDDIIADGSINKPFKTI